MFTRKKGVTEGQIEKALADLANTGMITLYQVDGESFFCFPNWHLHQRIQTKKSKFPPPPGFTVNHRESPPEVETETEIETEEETEGYSGEEPASPPPVILLPLNDGTEYPVSYGEYAEFVELYQAVDVPQQLKEGPTLGANRAKHRMEKAEEAQSKLKAKQKQEEVSSKKENKKEGENKKENECSPPGIPLSSRRSLPPNRSAHKRRCMRLIA